MHGRQVLYTFGPVVAWYDQVILTWSQPIPAMCGCKWVHLFFCVLFRHIHSYRYLHTFGELPIHSIHDRDLCRITSAELPLYSIYIPYSLLCMLLAGTLKHWVRSCSAKEVMPWKPWVTRNEETAAPNFRNVQVFNLESYIENGTSQRCFFVWIVCALFNLKFDDWGYNMKWTWIDLSQRVLKLDKCNLLN